MFEKIRKFGFLNKKVDVLKTLMAGKYLVITCIMIA